VTAFNEAPALCNALPDVLPGDDHGDGFLGTGEASFRALCRGDPFGEFLAVGIGKALEGGRRPPFAASACVSSGGISTTRSEVSTAMATVTRSPAAACAPACKALLTIIECVPSPFGISEF
jgi:hypothetical protein